MNTILYIETAGDRSVGIFPTTATLDLGFEWLEENRRDREILRQLVQTFFVDNDLFGEARVGVRFMDECPDCGSRMVQSVFSKSKPSWYCRNRNCIRACR